MCRISGTVNYPESVVVSMLDKQKRGGPDLSNYVTLGNVTLGHNLLSIIGFQEQPITLGTHSRYAMTFNGCWYDFKSFYPYSTSDTVSLLDHFTRRGLDALEDVNGMFAIGLYDKIEHKIHLIVDRFGQKPIYYYHNGNQFAFASNPMALYDLPETLEIDKDALQSYWLLGSVMGSEGIFKGIKKVCASEMVTYDLVTNLVTTSRYYDPKFQDKPDIEGLVIDAIDKVKVADVPIHIFLSGGIDSTLVASRFSGGNAIHLDSPEYVYAQEVATKYNINMIRVFPEDIDVEACLTDYSLNSGEPTMAGLIPYITAREVSKFGKVAITANGADELFFGYDRTHDYLTEKQLRHTYRDLELPKFKDDWHEYAYPFYTQFNGKTNGRMWELGGYIQYDLNKTLDSASMCHGLEVRSPFLDHRLVEAALSVPESVHRKKGNKTILKDMLRKMGFQDQFLNRPKIGFSLHKTPKDLDNWILKAVAFSKDFLQVDWKKLSGRDQRYLEMSALGFYFWYKQFKG